MPLQIGRFTLHEVRDCTLSVDGGAMFGTLPRSTWEKDYPVDRDHRVALAVRALLIVDGERRILIDDGIGDKLTPAQRALFNVDRCGFDFDRELARAGLDRAAITDVVLTHLHLDHAGGTTERGPDGKLRLAFPNAVFHLQRRHLRWAHHPTELDAVSFQRDDFEALEQSGRLHLLEGETELYDGVQICVSEGHTVGMQLVRIGAPGEELMYCADLVPTALHLAPGRCSAFDLHPLTAIEEKKMLLAQAIEDEAVLFFEHEPRFAACRLREVDGIVVPAEVVAL